MSGGVAFSRCVSVFVLALIGVLSLGGCGRSGETLFSALIADPVPSSVVIIRSQDELPLTPSMWMHFRIAPVDLDAILAAQGYVEMPTGGGDWLDARPPEVESWWDPALLGEGSVYYELELPDDHVTKGLWISAARDEAYFVAFFTS